VGLRFFFDRLFFRFVAVIGVALVVLGAGLQVLLED
jgi:hypothetical protein